MCSRPTFRTLAVLAAALWAGGCLEQDPVSPRIGPPAASDRDASLLHAPGEVLAFATNLEAAEVYVVRDHDHTLMRTLPVSVRPQHVTFAPDGRRAFITHNVSVSASDGSAALTVLRTADPSVVATVPAVPSMILNTSTGS
jgi:hypothetical protein